MRSKSTAQPVRMADVAKLAGVGTMTVSRLLSGSAAVSEKTAKRIHWAVEKLNYKPDQLARALRGRHTKTIGVVVPYLSDPFFAVCAHEINSIAKDYGYTVTVTSSNEDLATEKREAALMLGRRVDGLIVITAESSSDYLSGTEFEGTPVITVDRPSTSLLRGAVLVENREGAKLGTKHLIEHGHRNIAFVGLGRSLYTMKMRHQGYREAMAEGGLPTQPYVTCKIDADPTPLLRELMASASAPTALFAANNLVTRNILHSFRKLGVAIPGDVALIGFDDFEMAELLDPPITVIRQPEREIGRVAASTLFESIHHPETFEPARQVLPIEMVLRRSCGCPG